MPDQYLISLATAFASNTGGPYTATWDRAVVPAPGYIRDVWAVASSLSSNARTNSVDIYLQSDAPSAGSNTGSSVLQSPITLVNDNDAVQGTIRAGNDRVAAGQQLQLRTYADTDAATPAFIALRATIVLERD